MILNEKEIKGLLEKVIAANPGKTMSLGVSVQETGSTRFANNVITTNGVYNRLNIGVQLYKGKKSGIVVAGELDEAKLLDAVTRAAALAEVAPENAELMPMLGPQTYPPVPPLYYPATAAVTPEQRAEAIISVVNKAKARNLDAAGFFETSSYASVNLNSLGQYLYATGSRAYYSNTLRGGTGSGWAAADEEDIAKLKTGELADQAIETALASRDPQKLEAGKYTVILEPAAVLDIVGFMFWDYSGMAILDQRSFLTGRIGTKLFGDNITIWDDVTHPLQAGSPYDGEGVARKRVPLVENGIVRRVVYARSTAERMKHSELRDKAGPIEATGHGFPLPNEIGEMPLNIVFDPASDPQTVQQMIASTERGVLVTRLWYIREVEPFEKMLTGMTRDGTFYIENGKVQGGVRNFRFNESLIHMLSNVEAMSVPVRSCGEESFDMVVPAMKVRDFNFTEATKF